MAPTLCPPAASKSAMSIKLFVGAGIVAATAGTVVVASSSFSSEPTEAAPAVVASSSEAKAIVKPSAPDAVEAKVAAPSDEAVVPKDARLKAAWEERRSKIRKAHEAAGGFSWKAAEKDGDEEHAVHEIGECEDKSCVAGLADEVHELIKGCEDVMDEMPAGFMLEAQVIGAPDVGTVVESVEVVSGEDDASPELVECLTQQMYTLDFGEAETNFDQTIKMGMGAHELDLSALDGADLDEHTRAAIEQALAEKGLPKDGEATVHVLTLDASEHDPDAPERPAQ